MATSTQISFVFYGQYSSTSFGLICLSIILIYHGMSTYKHYKHNVKANKHCLDDNKCFVWPSLLKCSFYMLIIGILYCISGLSEVIYTEYISDDNRICYIHFMLLLSSYILFKFILYIALCQRIFESFGDAVLYSINPLFLSIWQIFLLLTTSLMLISCAFFVKVEPKPPSRPSCKITQFPDLLLIAIVAYDFIVCSINLILFLKPLCKLTDSLKDQSKKLSKKFVTLMKKNALLASISISTSVIAWIGIGIYDSLIVICQTLDIIVTSIAIILLFHRNEKIYETIFCCCMCLKCCKQNMFYNETELSAIGTNQADVDDPKVKIEKIKINTDNHNDDTVDNKSINDLEMDDLDDMNRWQSTPL